MKAFNCFLMICGVIVSSDFVFGASIEIRKPVSEKNEVVAAASSEGAVVPITDDLLKKAGERIAKIQESLIREINNQDNEDSLIQNLQNKTTKQLKIVGDKLVQTEEKVVSLGTKDNATIAIYKIINIRPLSFLVQTESKKSNSDQTTEPASENSDKSLDEPDLSLSWAKSQQSSQNDQSESDQQDSIKNESSQNDQPTQQDEPTQNEVSQNEQPVQQNQSAQNESAQNNEVAQQDQAAQNESAQNIPIVSVVGPDGIPRVIHGIAIKVAPKSDGTQGKDVAFQFFKK